MADFYAWKIKLSGKRLFIEPMREVRPGEQISDFPASAGAAWKNKAVWSDRKADFVGNYAASEFFIKLCREHVGQYGRLKAGRIGIDEKK